MLKRPITYVDFNGDETTENFYFNMSKAELFQLEASERNGFHDAITRVTKSENLKELIEEFKTIVLMAYGERSDDGKRFKKSPEIRADFESHAAFDVLFMELATDDRAATIFVNGVMPNDIDKWIDKLKANAAEIPDATKSSLPPPPSV